MTAMEYQAPATPLMQQSGFDYSQLDEASGYLAQRIAVRIRERNVSMAQYYIDNGKDLLAVKGRLSPYTWTEWLRAEFNWAPSVARSMVRIAELYGDLQLGESRVAASALRLLSHYDVPDTIRAAVVDQIKLGTIVSERDVLTYVEKHDSALSEILQRSTTNGSTVRARNAVREVTLIAAQIGFAVRSMQMALASSYSIPFPSAVADGLERLQDLADELARALPEDYVMSRRTQGIKHANTASSFVGVRFEKRTGKWTSQLRTKDKRHHIGTFLTEEEAARAYDAKARELYGDKARLNFPGNA